MQPSLTQSSAVRITPFTSTVSSRPCRRPAVTRASAQKSSEKKPSDVILMSVGALAAAQMALLPGAAMADAQPPPIKAATDVGEAVQEVVPKGAANPKTREERNSSRDEKLGNKLNTFKDRFDADKVAEGANTGDIFYGNGKNKGVSYSLNAPTLSSGRQFNVSQQLNKAAGDVAADAGQTVKSAATSDPLGAAKSAASDVTDAAKKAADKLPGQGIDTNPVSFIGSSLQVNISKKLNRAAADVASDAGQTVKSAASSDPLDAAKSAASDVTNAAKKAADKLPGQGIDTKPVVFSNGRSLQVSVVNQVNVDVNPVEQTKAAAQEAAASVKSQTTDNPLEALKNKINEASITSDSPQLQLDKAGNKAQQLKRQATSAVFGGSLQHNVSFTPATNSFMLADMANASFAGPQGNGGGVTQEKGEAFSKGEGNAVQGGDLKDSIGNKNAAQNKTSDLGRTAAQQDAAPRTAPKKQSGLPSVLGGDSLVRDDSETPEQVAKGNLAKAKQSNGNAIDSLKSTLGL